MIDDLAYVVPCVFDYVQMNAVINGQINAEHLECVKLHVSKKRNRNCCRTKLGNSEQCMVSCVQLEVQGLEMKQSDSEKYIGDFISSKEPLTRTSSTGRAKVLGNYHRYSPCSKSLE